MKHKKDTVEIQERRFLPFEEVRIAEDDNGIKTVVGYAAVFDKLSEDLGWYREKIAEGAFKRTLEEGADVRALIDHDSTKILGRNKAGTLKLKEDKSGLLATITPPDTSYARDLMLSIDRGDISGMSFGFITRTDEWNLEDGEEVRTLKDVDLFDVSVVTYPAYPDTAVALRSKDKLKAEVVEEDESTQDPLNVTQKNRLKRSELDLRT